MTAQIMDRIKFDNLDMVIQGEPDIPAGHEHINRLDELPLGLDEIFGSTACWRGYVASWEIRDDFLYLTDIKGIYVKSTAEPIKADWFSGEFRVVGGELLNYVHMPYASTYENEYQFQFERGRLIGKKFINNLNKDFTLTAEQELAKAEIEAVLDTILERVRKERSEEK